MRLSRLRVTNFRNLSDIDIPLVGDAVIVGENRSGKSNLVHAILLVLDPSLSPLERNLTSEDFAEALGPDPMADGVAIEASIEIVDFDDDPGLVAALHQALTSEDPMVAQLTYRFGPVETDEEQDVPAYEWTIYGGGDPSRRVGGDLRRYLHHLHMHALRDAAGDIASWRRSPLRPLLEELARSTQKEDLDAIAEALGAASEAVRTLDTVKQTAEDIERQTELLVGELHRLEPTLDLAPSDPERTLRSLRLYLDGEAQRRLSSASLGSLNVLYIALQELDLAKRLDRGEIEHALITIEEPEAHLHPHLQRRMFSGLLAGSSQKRSTVVTTHSPHIVSVTPPKNLVVLRDVDQETRAFAASEASLSSKAWDDLGRYFDATRSELVFARRILLVEGYAEQVLIPRITAPGLELNEHGVTVCSVHGTHFTSYAAFLQAVRTPYAVITDGDPDACKGKTGEDRARRLVAALDKKGADPADLGVFVGEKTFEADLFDSSAENAAAMFAALESLPLTKPMRATVEGTREAGCSGEEFLDFVEGQKGRFAQRLASTAEALDPPEYIYDAVEHVMS